MVSNKPTFRMSGAGRCPRALSAKYLNFEAEERPKWLDTAAKEGKWHEERIKQELAENEVCVQDEQLEVAINLANFDLVGHIDATVMNTEHGDTILFDTKRLLEAKSMSQFEFDRWMRGYFDAFPGYAAQLTCYMEATGLGEALYLVKNRNSGYLDSRVISGQPYNFEHIIGRLTQVTNAIACGELVPADFDPNNVECKRCEYKQHCLQKPLELNPVEESDLTDSAVEWRRGKELEAEAKGLIESARECFMTYTKQHELIKWRFSGLSISLVKAHRKEYTVPEKDYEQFRIDDLEKEE